MFDSNKNKELVTKYPFLYPRDFMGKKIEDYDYTYTVLDEMPNGWAISFGELLCEDIAEELKKCNQSNSNTTSDEDEPVDQLERYYLLQVKEKYGRLCWYDNGYPADSQIGEIIQKYEYISERTCIGCGAFPVPVIDTGWISPMCKKCFEKNEYFKGRDYSDYIEFDDTFDPLLVVTYYANGVKGKKNYDVSDIITRMRERKNNGD